MNGNPVLQALQPQFSSSEVSTGLSLNETFIDHTKDSAVPESECGVGWAGDNCDECAQGFGGPRCSLQLKLHVHTHPDHPHLLEDAHAHVHGVEAAGRLHGHAGHLHGGFAGDRAEIDREGPLLIIPEEDWHSDIP